MEELKVKGMMCHGCEKRVENALTELGLKNVKADHEKNSVFFENNGTHIDKIKERINDLGFEA